MSMLIVTDVESRVDKNGKDYVKLEISTLPYKVMKYEGEFIKVKIKHRVINMIAYPVSYLDGGAPEFGSDFEVGDYVEGVIVTREVQPYTVNDIQCNFYTTLVFCDEDDKDMLEAEIKKAFRRQGRRLLTDNKPLQKELQNANRMGQEVPQDCILHE